MQMRLLVICMGLQAEVEEGSRRLSGSGSPSAGTLLGTWPLQITSLGTASLNAGPSQYEGSGQLQDFIIPIWVNKLNFLFIDSFCQHAAGWVFYEMQREVWDVLSVTVDCETPRAGAVEGKYAEGSPPAQAENPRQLCCALDEVCAGYW